MDKNSTVNVEDEARSSHGWYSVPEWCIDRFHKSFLPLEMPSSVLRDLGFSSAPSR